MNKFIRLLIVSLALVSTGAWAYTPLQLAYCSAELSKAQDVAEATNDPDLADVFAGAQERVNTAAVAQGIPGSFINDYYAKLRREPNSLAWLNSNQVSIKSCIKASNQLK